MFYADGAGATSIEDTNHQGTRTPARRRLGMGGGPVQPATTSQRTHFCGKARQRGPRGLAEEQVLWRHWASSTCFRVAALCL